MPTKLLNYLKKSLNERSRIQYQLLQGLILPDVLHISISMLKVGLISYDSLKNSEKKLVIISSYSKYEQEIELGCHPELKIYIELADTKYVANQENVHYPQLMQTIYRYKILKTDELKK
ncbi:MAG: hypothetical protein ACOZBL_04035 [Patescibacteria group bacterium]